MSHRAPVSHDLLLTVTGKNSNHTKKLPKFECHHLQRAAPASQDGWDRAGLGSSSLFVSVGATRESRSSGEAAFQQPFGN